MVGNVWDRSGNALYDSMVRTYQEMFDELLILGVRDRGNKILLALPRKQPLSRDELTRLARKVSVATRALCTAKHTRALDSPHSHRSEADYQCP